MEQNIISVRDRKEGDLGTLPIDEFIEKLNNEIKMTLNVEE